MGSEQTAYSYADPMVAQAAFADNISLDNPTEAATLYAKTMYQHTQRQFQFSTSKNERRSSGSSSPVASLTSERSGSSSISSGSSM